MRIFKKKNNTVEARVKRLNIENLFLKKIPEDDDFNYMVLYNDSRGAVYKEEYKSLIKEAISKKIITVEKFIIAENVQDELYQIIEEAKGIQYNLIEWLKDYHQESDSKIAPLLYLLRKLDPNYLIKNIEDKLTIVSNIVEVEICPRIDGKNAKPRIFLTKEKIAIASTNDNIENLGDILSVKDVEIYIVGTDNRSNIICAYKLNRNDRFFEVSEGYKDRVTAELFSKVREKDY